MNVMKVTENGTTKGRKKTKKRQHTKHKYANILKY